MKTYYSDYAQHCMRFYATHSSTAFKNEVDKANWYACQSAMKSFPDKLSEIIIQVYCSPYSLSKAVAFVADGHNVKPETVWALIESLEHRIAKRRNLL